VSPPEFDIRLLPGYWLEQVQGTIDSAGWTIRKTHAPTVHYDGGLITLTPRQFKPVEKWIRECEWDDDDEVKPPTRSNPNGTASCSLEQDDESHRFSLHVGFPDGASFYAVDLKSKSQVRNILSMMLTYAPGSFDRGLFIDAPTLRKRIDRGWDVKRDGPLLMESAIYWDAADVVALLATSGVDARGGPDGKTYLTIAIHANRPACVRALIAAGARLDAGSPRDRDAAVAAAGHSLELVQIVVAQGLSVNTKKGAGTGFAVGATMLMAAIVSEHIDIVRWLLDHGARIDNVDNEGHTALVMAAGAGSQDIVALLLSRNAAPDLRDRQAAAMSAEAGAQWMQGELDALRQSGSPVGPNDLAYFEGRIANWRAIVALLAQR